MTHAYTDQPAGSVEYRYFQFAQQVEVEKWTTKRLFIIFVFSVANEKRKSVFSSICHYFAPLNQTLAASRSGTASARGAAHARTDGQRENIMSWDVRLGSAAGVAL